MYQKSKIIFLIFFLVSCNNNKQENKRLQLISKITIEGNNNSAKLDSKFALSDNVVLFQANSYYHTSESTADSTVVLIVNGKKIPEKRNFSYLLKKYNLQSTSLNNLLFSKNDELRNSESILKKYGDMNVVRQGKDGTIYQMYNKDKNIQVAYLNIYYPDKEVQTFKFNVKNGTPAFFLHDINGDGKEELFYTEWDFGYLGYIYHIKIFEIKL